MPLEFVLVWKKRIKKFGAFGKFVKFVKRKNKGKNAIEQDEKDFVYWFCIFN